MKDEVFIVAIDAYVLVLLLCVQSEQAVAQGDSYYGLSQLSN